MTDDLFPTNTQPTAPGDSQAGPVEVQGDWTPERLDATGKPRPRFWMPELAPVQARNMGRKLDEYREKKQNDR